MPRLSFALAMACAIALTGAAAPPKDAVLEGRIVALEAALQHDPEDLFAAAEYRQLVIASGDFDRSIRVLQALAKRSAAGPNVHLSLGLAYVDKVPTSGEIRRLYLARDAINEATRAIERAPTVLAYYMRGQIYLYFNTRIFHRTQSGIDDLRTALSLVTPQTPAGAAAHVYAALGDGYWKLDDRDAARDAWRHGAARYPDDARLKARLSGTDAQVADVVRAALSPNHRVDTTLAEDRP